MSKKKEEEEKFTRKEQMKILKESLRTFDRRMEFDTEVYNEEKKIVIPSADDIT